MVNSRIIPVKIGSQQVWSFILMGEKQAVIVDTGVAGSEKIIIKKMSANGIKPEQVSLILLTHAHYDHFGSALALKKITGAPIAIHKEDAPYIQQGENAPFNPIGIGKLFMPVIRGLLKKEFEPILPDLLITDSQSLDKYGVSGKTIHTPGHTPGSISILLPEGEILVGDMMRGGLLGRPLYHFGLDNINDLKDSIKKVISFSPRAIICSHGHPFVNPQKVAKVFEVSQKLK